MLEGRGPGDPLTVVAEGDTLQSKTPSIRNRVRAENITRKRHTEETQCSWAAPLWCDQTLS